MNGNTLQFNRSAIDIGQCLGKGWAIVKPNYIMFVAVALILVLLGCLPVISWFLIGPLLVGIYSALLKQYRGENADFATIFSGFSKFFPAFVIGLLFLLPSIVLNFYNITLRVAQFLAIFNPNELSGAAAAAFTIFGILLNVLVFFGSILCWISFGLALPLLAEHNLSIMETIKLSARAGWANLGGMILLLLVMGLMIIGGILALCIGIFFVLPLVYAATIVAYRQVFPVSGQAPPVFQASPGDLRQGY